jgi:hypothetical protein
MLRSACHLPPERNSRISDNTYIVTVTEYTHITDMLSVIGTDEVSYVSTSS